MATVTLRGGDEPRQFIGDADGYQVVVDRGDIGKPRSIELFLLGLGTCTISTVDHFLRRKELPTDDLMVEVSSELDEVANAYGDIRIILHLSDAIPEDMQRIVRNVAKSCRIHKTITSAPEIEISAERERPAA
ncbi:MAG: putative OsmC-like protein [Alphaproteobacteria bacterium]|jgi:uncharacterized OsmC-like protein